jgi:hypothetical protein
MHTRLDEHDTARTANRIALSMIVTFLVTFGCLYWKQKASEVPAAIALPGQPMPAATAVELSRVVAPSAEEQPADAPLVPVIVRIRHVRQQGKVEGSIKSLSATPLNIILVGTNHEGDETARVSIQLAPFESKSFSTDDGLELQSGGHVLAQSQGYQDRDASIP